MIGCLIAVSAVCSVHAGTLEDTQTGVRKRIVADIATIRGLVSRSSLDMEAKDAAYSELDGLETEAQGSDFPSSEEGFRAILPLNGIHRNVFEVYSRVLALGASTPLTVWHTLRFDRLGLFAKPEGTVSALTIRMMKNEQRSTAINITNRSQEERRVDISVTDLPASCILRVYQGEFVDTKRVEVGPGSKYSAGHDQAHHLDGGFAEHDLGRLPYERPGSQRGVSKRDRSGAICG